MGTTSWALRKHYEILGTMKHYEVALGTTGTIFGRYGHFGRYDLGTILGAFGDYEGTVKGGKYLSPPVPLV